MSALVTDNLPLLAGAPNGIKKLRELILELAVRGKLVLQDPNDEPASELLKRIAEEKARLVAEGKIKKQKPLTAISEDEKPFTLPTNWEWVRLDSLLKKIGAGSTPLGGKQAYVVDGIKFLRSQNVWNEGLRLNDVAFITEQTHQKMSGTHVEAGDLLFNITGASIGRCAAVPYNFDTGNVSQHVTIIRPVSGGTQPYLHVVLVSKLVQQTVMDVQVGVSREGLSIGKLAQFLIPFPPEAEQHRIVAKVDELMALCDRLEAKQADAEIAHAQLVQALLDSLTLAVDADDFTQSWQRLAEHFHTLFTTESSIDALKQTLLQLAVMGKLVPQDPNDEPASELLKRIAEEKARLVAEGKLKKQKPLDGVSDAEKTFELPPGWAWGRFADFALEISTGPFGSLIHQSDYVNGGIPLVNPSHIINGRIVPDHSVALSPKMAASLDSYRLSTGDMVMARRGEVGRVAIVTNSEDGWLCGTGSFVLRFSQEVSRAYIWTLFRCNSIRTYLAGVAVGTTMVNLNHGILMKMPTAIPPLPEQHRIVAKVDQLMALCDQLKQRLSQARTLHEQLANTLVEQAAA